MKKILIVSLLLTIIPASANADVYVAVDANGIAVGGAIMCDAGTCGAGSSFSQATLPTGAHYALQGIGVDYGIGNNNPNTQVQVNNTNTEWTVTRTQVVTPVEPIIINNQQVISYTAQTVEKFGVFTVSPVIPPVIPPAPIADTTTSTATITPSAPIVIPDTSTVSASLKMSNVKANKIKINARKKGGKKK